MGHYKIEKAISMALQSLLLYIKSLRMLFSALTSQQYSVVGNVDQSKSENNH